MTDYYVDGDVGNDSNLGTSEGSGNAWATINKGVQTIVAGDTLYVKAKAGGAAYNENAVFANQGTSRLTAGMIQVIGYTTTPGDGGRVKHTCTTGVCIDDGTLSGNGYIRLHNFHYYGGTSQHVLLNLQAVELKNIWSVDSAAEGIVVGSGAILMDCLIQNPALECVSASNNPIFSGCSFLEPDSLNAWTAANSSPTFYKCWFANHDYAGGSNIYIAAQMKYMIGCTVDGRGQDGGIRGNGIRTTALTLAVNADDFLADNVFVGLTNGIEVVTTASTNGPFGAHNNFWGDSTESPNGLWWDSVTNAEADILGIEPLTLIDEDTAWEDRYNDYTPAAGADLIGAGVEPPAEVT